MIGKKKRTAVLFTGGKDSCLALHMAKLGGLDIKYLLSVIPKNFDSFMFHKPSLELLKLQAERLGIELVIRGTKGEEERELEDLRLLINKVKKDVDVIVVGGIASSYQGSRIRKICEKLGLKFYAPLWGFSSEQVWKNLLSKGFEVVLTKISCEGIPKEFLGKVIDLGMFNKLKRLSERYKFRIDFEGGEAETAVLKMPEFKKHICIKYNVKSEGEYRYWLDINKVY